MLKCISVIAFFLAIWFKIVIIRFTALKSFLQESVKMGTRIWGTSCCAKLNISIKIPLQFTISTVVPIFTLVKIQFRVDRRLKASNTSEACYAAGVETLHLSTVGLERVHWVIEASILMKNKQKKKLTCTFLSCPAKSHRPVSPPYQWRRWSDRSCQHSPLHPAAHRNHSLPALLHTRRTNSEKWNNGGRQLLESQHQFHLHSSALRS